MMNLIVMSLHTDSRACMQIHELACRIGEHHMHSIQPGEPLEDVAAGETKTIGGHLREELFLKRSLGQDIESREDP